MDELKKLIIPEKSEIVILLGLSLALLFVENFNRYKNYWSAGFNEGLQDINIFDSYFKSWFVGLEVKIDPRFVDFIVWLFVGAIAFAVLSVLIALYNSANQEVKLIHYYRYPSSRNHEIITFISKIAIRFVAAVGLLVWFAVFIKHINPALAARFFYATVHISQPISWLWIPLTIIVFATSIYVFAVLARLIALKVRVFS